MSAGVLSTGVFRIAGGFVLRVFVLDSPIIVNNNNVCHSFGCFARKITKEKEDSGVSHKHPWWRGPISSFLLISWNDASINSAVDDVMTSVHGVL